MGRSSHQPHLLTRADLQQVVGVSLRDLDTWERQHICRPVANRSPGDTRPVQYDLVEAGLVRMAHHASRIGIRGRRLAEILELVRVRRDRLNPGWAGTVIYDGAAVDLIPAEVNYHALLEDPLSRPVLVLPLTVPAASDG
jgi:hypothetical protein